MTALVQVARKPYAKTSPPQTYDPRWLTHELANIQGSQVPQSVRTATVSETPHTYDSVVLYNATGGAISVTLPLPGQVKNLVLYLKKIDSSVNAVTIVGTIDGVANPTLATQYKSKTIVSDGISWYQLASV